MDWAYEIEEGIVGRWEAARRKDAYMVTGKRFKVKERGGVITKGTIHECDYVGYRESALVLVPLWRVEMLCDNGEGVREFAVERLPRWRR